MRSHPYLLFILALQTVVAWIACSQEDDGTVGRCPDRATCCPTSSAPEGFSCIPANAQDPTSARGFCCDDGGDTGCGYGYQCAVDSDGTPYCKLQKDHPTYVYNDTSRYELCSVPLEMQTFFEFPMGRDDKKVLYYSNMGDIRILTQKHLQVSRVVIIVHGSERNVEDYFCAGLSLLQDDHDKNRHPMDTIALQESTLVIAPLFAAPEDGPLGDDVLVWADHPDILHRLSHSWRYGSDALNAPVSSYAVLDALVEYLVASAHVQYPHLRRVAVAGHSAGGQVTHRWALLSNSPAWKDPVIDIVSVVANPRSYCYLDERRVHFVDGTFRVPDDDDIKSCPGYDQWQWGLKDGGYLKCPYRDEVLRQLNATEVAHRYSGRNVIYLSGQLDTLPANDTCATTVFQGSNRQERARNYVRSLQELFPGRVVHEWYIIQGSPHDHTLMFQSEQGKKSIFGDIDSQGIHRE